MKTVHRKFYGNVMFCLFIFCSFFCNLLVASNQHLAMQLNPIHHIVIDQTPPTHRDTSSAQAACFLSKKRLLPNIVQARRETGSLNYELDDNDTCKQIIKTIAVAAAFSSCLACTGIILLAIKSQNN